MYRTKTIFIVDPKIQKEYFFRTWRFLLFSNHAYFNLKTNNFGEKVLIQSS